MSNATNVKRKISMDVCERYIVEVLQIYTGHSVEHRVESIQIFIKTTWCLVTSILDIDSMKPFS